MFEVKVLCQIVLYWVYSNIETLKQMIVSSFDKCYICEQCCHFAKEYKIKNTQQIKIIDKLCKCATSST